MSDFDTDLLMEGLARAAGASQGLPLVGSRAAQGLFGATAAGKQAAKTAAEQGFVRVLRTERRGRAIREIWTISEVGLARLLKQASPREALDALKEAVSSCQQTLNKLQSHAKQAEEHLGRLERAACDALARAETYATCSNGDCSQNGERATEAIVLECLKTWNESGDCPLPVLHAAARKHGVEVTLGEFHDAVRSLSEREIIYLHPWTGPLYEVPEPAAAMMSGHEVAYYASLRCDTVTR